MKKLLAILAVFAFVLSGMTFATDSAGLGVPVWMTLDDDSVVFSYVGQLNSFKNLALLELTGPGFGFGGATFDLSGNALGIYAGKDIVNSGLYSDLNSFIFSLPGVLKSTASIGATSYNLNNTVDTPDNQLLALYGLGLEGMDIGIGLGYSASGLNIASKTTYEAKDEISGSQSQINALLGVSLKGDMPIDVALSLGLPSSTNKVVDQRWDGTENASKEDNEDKVEASGMDLGISARGVIGGDLIANLGFAMSSGKITANFKKDGNDDGDWEDQTTDTKIEISGEKSLMGIDLGVAKLLKVNNINIISGLTFNYSSSTEKGRILKDKLDSANDTKGTEDSSTSINLGINVAAEAKLNDTWSARVGAQKGIFGTSSTTSKNLDTLTETTSSSDTTSNPVISMGASCVIGNLTIDGVINHALLFDGPYFIGGKTTGMASQISVKYSW